VRAARAVALAAAVLCSAVAPSSAATPSATEMRQADRHCQGGLKALQAGNLAKAREAFAKAFAAAPDFPPAHLGLGHVASAEQDFETALAEYTKAREAWGTFGELLGELEMERWSRTQDEIRRMEDQLRDMRNQDRASDAGESLSTTQRTLETSLEQRIQTLQAVPRPVPGARVEPPADLEFHRGNALFRLARYEEARVAWEASAEQNPKFALVHNNLAVLYYKAGRIEDARRAVAAAEALGMTVHPDLKADIERAAAARR
jgi:tetratricopeptide (TPR) repeat protein